MKRGMGPDDVAEFIDTYLARKYSRQLDRFFAGTIVSVTGTGPYTCTVQRTGETAADGNTYLCATPAYTPKVGEVVECMWRDNASGYVLWPVSTPPTVAPVPWIPVSFQGTWRNYNTPEAGGDWMQAAYHKVGTRVFLKGLIAANAPSPWGTVAFTLPVGYRPTYGELFGNACSAGSYRLDIHGNGDVQPGQTMAGTDTSYVSISGISFETT